MPSEQDLIDDLAIEVIKINGYDMVYLPREFVREDELFGEDRSPSSFTTGREIEMLVDSVDGFEGDGELFSRFGLEIKDNVTLSVARRRFEQEFADLGFDTPREGDLIFFPISGGLFEIDFVERHNPFFQLNKISTYQMTCSLFRYTGESFDTDWSEIDGMTASQRTQFTVLTLGAGSGNYSEGEFVIQGDGSTIAAQVEEWYSASTTLHISGVTGSFQDGVAVVGQSSGVSYTLSSSGITNQFAVNDIASDNSEFELQSPFDFTDTDPFSGGDL